MKTPEKITQFSDKTIELVRGEIEAALKSVGQKLNVNFTVGSITYSSMTSTARARLNFAANAPDGSVINQAREDWNRYAKTYGLQPEWLDQTFYHEFEELKIVGLYPHRRRLSVALLRLRDNSPRIASPDFVSEGMNRKESVRKAKEEAKKSAAANAA